MTLAQQAEYLIVNGWKRDGEHWRDASCGYLWETSAAVAHQRWREREKAKARADGKQTANVQPQ